MKGKRVGLPLGTVVEFYLGRSLLLNGLSMKDITPVNLLPSQMADAMVNGDIDAAVVWEPYVTQIEERAPTRPQNGWSNRTAPCSVFSRAGTSG